MNKPVAAPAATVHKSEALLRHSAETYAREMSGLEDRLAPVDLRSFERERPGWLVRRRRHERRYCDRTGLPPTWATSFSQIPPMTERASCR